MTLFNAWPAGLTRGTQAFYGGVFDGSTADLTPFGYVDYTCGNTAEGTVRRNRCYWPPCVMSVAIAPWMVNEIVCRSWAEDGRILMAPVGTGAVSAVVAPRSSLVYVEGTVTAYDVVISGSRTGAVIERSTRASRVEVVSSGLVVPEGAWADGFVATKVRVAGVCNGLVLGGTVRTSDALNGTLPELACRRCVDVARGQSGAGTVVFSLPASEMAEGPDVICMSSAGTMAPTRVDECSVACDVPPEGGVVSLGISGVVSQSVRTSAVPELRLVSNTRESGGNATLWGTSCVLLASGECVLPCFLIRVPGPKRAFMVCLGRMATMARTQHGLLSGS